MKRQNLLFLLIMGLIITAACSKKDPTSTTTTSSSSSSTTNSSTTSTTSGIGAANSFSIQNASTNHNDTVSYSMNMNNPDVAEYKYDSSTTTGSLTLHDVKVVVGKDSFEVDITSTFTPGANKGIYTIGATTGNMASMTFTIANNKHNKYQHLPDGVYDAKSGSVTFKDLVLVNGATVDGTFGCIVQPQSGPSDGFIISNGKFRATFRK